METEPYWERYRTHEQIRKLGAMSNLAGGIGITTHGVDTRLIAWPGNGFQTMAVHVMTLQPGEKSEDWTYDMAEEAIVSFKGKGQMYVRGKWVDVAPGDIGYWPRGAKRQLANPRENKDPMVVVTCISPPQFDLYEDAGFYDATHKVMDFDAIQYAKINATRVELGTKNEMEFRDPKENRDVRAWRLSNEQIARDGALFNAFYGAPLTGLVQGGGTSGASMLLILFAGFGTGNTGFNFACMTPGMTADIHTHPVSDECVINWWGGNPVWLGDQWIQSSSYDCLLAPCGVRHGGYVPADAKDSLYVGGLASPPQLDLLISSGYYENGTFSRPDGFTRLSEK